MTKSRQQAPTTYTIDADGQRLAHVALANTDQRATLYAEDLERLLAEGWSPYWCWTNTGSRFRYVLAYARSPDGRQRSITIARLIAGAGKGRKVEYVNGDHADLRRDNLRIVRGGGCAKTPATAVLPRLPCNLPENTGAPQEAQGEHRDTMPPPAAYVPHVVDRVALAARVREQLAQRVPQPLRWPPQ